jgi:hypothetical protein
MLNDAIYTGEDSWCKIKYEHDRAEINGKDGEGSDRGLLQATIQDFT